MATMGFTKAMNAIIGMADLLWETPLASQQREYVRIFKKAGSQLLDLINDILDLSKVESGHLTLESLDFDLTEVMDKTLEIMANQTTVTVVLEDKPGVMQFALMPCLSGYTGGSWGEVNVKILDTWPGC